MENRETEFVLEHLKLLPYKYRVENTVRIPQSIINNETIPYHKVNYYLQNLEFDNAENYLTNIPNEISNITTNNINQSRIFYNTYGICFTINNETLVNELKSKYFKNMLKTTHCRHDKTGNTMMIDCWKCN